MNAPPTHTREVLLAAGRDEFAEKGLAGARVDRIADVAGVNKQRIYAFFGSKVGLFEAVLADALEDLASGVQFGGADDVAAYMTRVAAYHRDHPHLLRLLLWEQLERPADARGEQRHAFYAAKRERTSALLPDLSAEDAGALLFQLIGLAVWPMVLPGLARLLGVDSGGEAVSSLRDQLAAACEELAKG